jgi:hypothetical protein
MASTSKLKDPKSVTKYHVEKKIGNEILQHVRKLNLPFKLDQLTEGQGNCFPIAIIQQCRRHQVLSSLPSNIQQMVKHENGHSLLRIAVSNFATMSQHPRVQSFKFQYIQNVAPAMGETWEEYWKRMAHDRIWVDYLFIQATAWFIRCDILIADTSCREENPYIHISGNIDHENQGCKELIYLGSKSNCHYQSLLEIEEATVGSITTEQVAENFVNSSSKILKPNKNTNSKVVEN